MIICIKIGTHSATHMHVVRKRAYPKLGECFEVKELNARGKPERWDKPLRVYCDLIKDIGGRPLYFVERM